MLRMYINLFLTLLIPVTILSMIVAVIILALRFEISQAIKLGILAGVAAGVTLSALLPLFLMIKRRFETTIRTLEPQASVLEESSLGKTPLNKPNNTFILFMNNILAFETSVYVITKEMIGEIIRMDGEHGIIDLKDTQNGEYRLNIQPLTAHTSIVQIETSESSKTSEQISHAIKEMNRSFMRY